MLNLNFLSLLTIKKHLALFYCGATMELSNRAQSLFTRLRRRGFKSEVTKRSEFTVSLFMCYVLIVVELGTGVFQTTLATENMPGEIWYYGYGNFKTTFDTVHAVLNEVLRLRNVLREDEQKRVADMEWKKIDEQKKLAAKEKRKEKYKLDRAAAQKKLEDCGFCCHEIRDRHGNLVQCRKALKGDSELCILLGCCRSCAREHLRKVPYCPACCNHVLECSCESWREMRARIKSQVACSS